MNFAVEHKIPIIAVHLKKTDLPDGLSLTLSSRQAILKHEIPIEEYQQKLLSRISSYLNQDIATAERVIKQKSAPAIGAVIAFALVAVALVASLMIYNQEDAQ